jgi:enoyl-CoA hydratase
MVERAQDLVKIDVSGLVFNGCFTGWFKWLNPQVTTPRKSRPKRPKRGTDIPDNIVKLDRAETVATITLDRPDNGNRIDADMASALVDTCRLVAEDDGLRLVVLTANGDVFCVDDGTEAAGNPAAALAGLAVPVLVALNGYATGPGLELALAGDLRICVPSARFGFPGLARGVLPHDGGTQRLPRLVGPAWAQDMLLTGRMVDAKEALAIGLVNRVAKPGQLDALVAEIAAQIIAGSPVGARYAKEAAGKGMELSLEQGLGLEADLNVILQSTLDRAEGLDSFLEKRGPKFTGS